MVSLLTEGAGEVLFAALAVAGVCSGNMPACEDNGNFRLPDSAMASCPGLQPINAAKSFCDTPSCWRNVLRCFIACFFLLNFFCYFLKLNSINLTGSVRKKIFLKKF